MKGGSQAQDHGQAIYAKIRYSVSSTFATGCSSVYLVRIPPINKFSPLTFLYMTALIYRKLSFTCVISNWISLFNITPLPSLHQLLISWCFQMVSSHKPSCYISYYWINPKCIQPLPLFQWEVYCYGVKYSNFAR